MLLKLKYLSLTRPFVAYLVGVEACDFLAMPFQTVHDCSLEAEFNHSSYNRVSRVVLTFRPCLDDGFAEVFTQGEEK